MKMLGTTRDSLLAQSRTSLENGDGRGAETNCRTLLTIDPTCAEALNNLGLSLQQQDRLEEAAAVFHRLTLQAPALPIGHKNLGVILCALHRLEEGFASLRRHAQMVYQAPTQTHAEGNPDLAPKLKHDAEQRVWLNTQGHSFSPSSPLPFHISGGSRVVGSALNPKRSIHPLSTPRKPDPLVWVIDHLLSETALAEFQRFCWDSTIWQKIYADGYLGAMSEDGFGSPLLAQIDQELRQSWPHIFRNLPLCQCWAFKYDSRMRGIGLHADSAAVNINFWITPDDANLDPQSGGLVLWDEPAPQDWSFAQYNQDQAGIRRFLEEKKAHSVTVPFRTNRAIIFRSDLFHKTDDFTFRAGYLNRRINITLLYGQRGDPSPNFSLSV